MTVNSSNDAVDPAAEIERPAATALEMSGVWFGYSHARPVLKGIDLRVESATTMMILGTSGGGKTTLLKLAKGLLKPLRGEISVIGQRLTNAAGFWGSGRLDHRVAYIPQQLGLVRNLTVIENVLTGALAESALAPSLFKQFPRSRRDEANELLEALGIAHKAEEKAFALSGGERQRVAIARALMQRPRLILADEIISQLDPATGAEIMEIARSIVARGVALVMATHNLEAVSRYADRVVLLHDGEKILDCAGGDTTTADLSRRMKR